MDRRKAIKNLAIVSSGLITLPQWMVSCGVSDTTIHHSSFSVAEQKILASITDTIIPAGNSIGALSVGVDKFLQKLIDDCYEKDTQDNVKTQLKSLEESAKTTNNRSFADCTQAQREQLLLKLSTSTNKVEKDFFDLIKSETIRGFNTSQKIMEEYLGYKVAPGHYYGSVDIKAADHA
ncbi:MAG: gluconate 2-dehydrogenase subunit 3 family protein [Bacteroidetes bacterium]|nr:MAG: gluconate 2-dehydrogenase subunit 3 family protein [Bacteroidota bacterium]